MQAKNRCTIYIRTCRLHYCVPRCKAEHSVLDLTINRWPLRATRWPRAKGRPSQERKMSPWSVLTWSFLIVNLLHLLVLMLTKERSFDVRITIAINIIIVIIVNVNVIILVLPNITPRLDEELRWRRNHHHVHYHHRYCFQCQRQRQRQSHRQRQRQRACHPLHNISP